MLDFIGSLFDIYIVFLHGFTVSNYLFYSVIALIYVFVVFSFVYRLIRRL